MKKLVLTVAIFTLAVAASLNAQVAGRVTGTVVDASGAAVPNASVSLQLPGSGANVYSTVTNSNGSFNIVTVNPATYDLVIETDVLQIDTVKQREAELFLLKPFIDGLSSEFLFEGVASKTLFATHPNGEWRSPFLLRRLRQGSHSFESQARER